MSPGDAWTHIRKYWTTYRLRWKRRELLWRCIRAGRRLLPVVDRTGVIDEKDILLFAAIRNEGDRLPEFLSHYRKLGVDHFLIVDNGSDDGTIEYLQTEPDVSLWRCYDSYRKAKFGMDWLGSLLMRYGHKHWCLTVDADEFLIYPYWDSCDLKQLTAKLDQHEIEGIGALMLDLYGQGAIGEIDADKNAPLTERLSWFDPGPYRTTIVEPKRNRIVRGGVRERVFFADHPERGPTLNKLPLIRWHWRHVYVNSTHSLLPSKLNELYDGPGGAQFSGVLLHAKFEPAIASKSVEELIRLQHFVDPGLYTEYHHSLTKKPTLWYDGSEKYLDWRQLVNLKLMNIGDSLTDLQDSGTWDSQRDRKT